MDENTSIVARDFLTLILMGFVALVVIMLAHLRPPTEDASMKAAGNLVFEVRWPDDSRADVDLWLLSPGGRPVGYSRKAGEVLDLLRDDLGRVGDLTNTNFEFAFSRGAPPGEYVVNVHLFSQSKAVLPVPVDVTVSMRHPQQSTMVRIFSGRVHLTKPLEELTVIRFRLDAEGKVVQGSKTTLPKSIRSMK